MDKQNTYTKKAAMFGLDARIALTIFGTLSIITGAALYSAIKNSKTISNINQMEEIGKAIISYYIDTGEYIPYDEVSGLTDLSSLITSNKPGWKGPYIQLEPWGLPDCLVVNNNHLCVRLRKKESVTNQSAPCDTVHPKSSNCGFWIEWYNIHKDIKQSIDLRIDKVLDPERGNVRICPAPACNANGSLFYYLDIT